MIHLSKCSDVPTAKTLRKFSEFFSTVSRRIGRQINYLSGGLPTKCSAASEELVTKFFDEPTFWHLEFFVKFSSLHPFFLVSTGQ